MPKVERLSELPKSLQKELKAIVGRRDYKLMAGRGMEIVGVKTGDGIDGGWTLLSAHSKDGFIRVSVECIGCYDGSKQETWRFPGFGKGKGKK